MGRPYIFLELHVRVCSIGVDLILLECNARVYSIGVDLIYIFRITWVAPMDDKSSLLLSSIPHQIIKNYKQFNQLNFSLLTHQLFKYRRLHILNVLSLMTH